MKINHLLLFLFSTLLNNYSYCQSGNKINDQVELEIEFDQFSNNDSVYIEVTPMSMAGLFKNRNKELISIPVNDKKTEHTLQVNESVFLEITTKAPGENILFRSFVEPGDTLVLHVNGNTTTYSGNSIAKYEVEEKIENSVEDRKWLMNIIKNHISNFSDFAERDQYMNKLLNKKLPTIDSMKSGLSASAYQLIRIRCINDIERRKLNNWFDLSNFYIKTKKDLNNISEQDHKDLVTAFDDAFDLQEMKWLRAQTDAQAGNYEFLQAMYQRDWLVDPEIRNAEGKTGRMNRKLLIKYAAKIYTGMAQEAAMANLISMAVIHDGALEMGFPPEYDTLMNQYYNGPYDKRFKEYVKAVELDDREYSLSRGAYVINSYLSLPDNNNSTFNYQKLKGKVVLIRFWKSGQQTDNLDAVYNKYKADCNVLFLNINVDKDKAMWLSAIKQNNYNRPGIINLYTDGQGETHPLVHALLLDKFPKTFYSTTSSLIKRPGEDGVVASIGKELSKLHDGPYIFANDKGSQSFYITNGTLKTDWLGNKVSKVLKVATDEYNKEFNVNIYGPYVNAPSSYVRPEKLLSLSDIEGNFDAFRKLLQSNKVIDKNYNWIFGKGHLVFSGDMFDRGEQVTECLWLAYTLEQKAKAAGGYVHFILGNHEIMNLQGDHRYVKQKYKDNAILMDKSLTELYGENTELGKWLRTKNIIEKIGDLLFCHGGISPEINQLNISISDINQLARPHYADTTKNYNDPTLATIMSTSVGPFWYRSYYKPKVAETAVDSTLQKFMVRHIITGHTVISDTISTHYHNKVINTDTKHADSKSEALLIEGDKFYRVNDKGDKVLLFVDDKRKVGN